MSALTLVRWLVAVCLLLNTATLTACLLLLALTGQTSLFLTPFSAMATTLTALTLRSLRGAR